MKLRTRLSLVVTGLTAAFVILLLLTQIQTSRASVREEIEAANRVAAQMLRPLADALARASGADGLTQFLEDLGRIRANELELRAADGTVLYRSPPATYKAGREAPSWFAALLAPEASRQTHGLPGGVQITIEANSSRAVLDAWDDILRLLGGAALILLVANFAAFRIMERALKPFPVIVHGLQRLQQGDLNHRLPPLAGSEASAIGAAFNGMAHAIEDKMRIERQAREAEHRLEERRELALLVDQRIEEERRLIAHELHDEFGQSVTAIRSLALAIATRADVQEANTAATAQLIADEAARLYDAMHGLIPRLAPLSLDTLALAEILDSLVRDWQRRHPGVSIRLRQALPHELGPSVTLAAYRLVQEGLINALRHAQAAVIDVDVQGTTEALSVTLQDDGIGLPDDWHRPGHFGLRGLAQRVETLGGIFEVARRDPRGTVLRARIPLAGRT